ncbi:MAG: DedA family protein [Terriglobales bacterium]|jgi:membrane protein DedA with SNARE-associated domain
MHPLHHLREFVANYGYWAVAVALLIEHAGIPVPAETTLLFASFLAYSEHRLQLGWIIVVATCAGTLGGELGYALGYHGGRPLLDRYERFFHIHPTALAKGESLFARYGAATVFLGRFIFGMRLIVGPLAGVLRMKPRTFLLVNFLGTAAWVTLFAGAGYLFGRNFPGLVRTLGRANLVLLILAVLAIGAYLLWSRRARGAQA